MRKFVLLSLLVVASCGVLVSGSLAGKNISGDYVEARTASVFAGACHFNGEVVTTGREAVLAWHIKSGEWKGTSLAGVKAVAAVSAASNLSEANHRRAEVVVDANATEAQVAALAEIMQVKYGAALGRVTEVRRAPVTFQRESGQYKVEAAGFATLNVQAMPNDECCKMPNMVWYAPLVPVSNRKVGYTVKASYAGGAVGDTWERADENSAFYGTFAF